MTQSYFDLAVSLARAQAMHEIPDATSGIDRHNDECSARADMLEAAKKSDVSDSVTDYLTTTNQDTAKEVVRWFLDALVEEDPVSVIQAAAADRGWIGDRLREAARAKALNDWETRYGK